MRLKRETQGAFCVLNANAKSQTRKSMKINVICTVAYHNSLFMPGRPMPYLCSTQNYQASVINQAQWSGLTSQVIQLQKYPGDYYTPLDQALNSTQGLPSFFPGALEQYIVPAMEPDFGLLYRQTGMIAALD